MSRSVIARLTLFPQKSLGTSSHKKIPVSQLTLSFLHWIRFSCLTKEPFSKIVALPGENHMQVLGMKSIDQCSGRSFVTPRPYSFVHGICCCLLMSLFEFMKELPFIFCSLLYSLSIHCIMAIFAENVVCLLYYLSLQI